jgi:hypothetical protein
MQVDELLPYLRENREELLNPSGRENTVRSQYEG